MRNENLKTNFVLISFQITASKVDILKNQLIMIHELIPNSMNTSFRLHKLPYTINSDDMKLQQENSIFAFKLIFM